MLTHFPHPMRCSTGEGLANSAGEALRPHEHILIEQKGRRNVGFYISIVYRAVARNEMQWRDLMTTNKEARAKPSRTGLARRLSLFASGAALIAALGVGGVYAVTGQSNMAVAENGPAPVTIAQPAGPAAGFADLVQKVKPAVISVRVKIQQAVQPTMGQDGNNPFPPGSPFRQFFRQFGFPNIPQRHGVLMGQGSGFFISSDGYAVTNNHVVEHAKSVQVITDNGKTYNAKVIGTDAKTDLALIKVNGTGFTYVQFADKLPRVGDWVVAIGNPFGLGGTVTAGIVSAEGRDIGTNTYDNFIQIDAPINKGNSGGPAFDLSGKVVGINTAIYSPSGGSVGIGFDIPASTAKSVISQIMQKGHVTRGWLGVQVQAVNKDLASSLGLKHAKGALVDQTTADSPAGRAGLKAGDVIVAVNGAPVKDSRDLAQKIGAMAPGASVKLNVIRNGNSREFGIKLAEMPSEQQLKMASNENSGQMNNTPKLGLAVQPADQVAGSGHRGLAIVGIDPNGPAAQSGLQVGDVILDAAGKPVSKASDITQAVAQVESKGRHALLLRVKSQQGTHFVAVPLKKA